MTTTLITGANKGLGYATARSLVELGHTVWIGARDPERGGKAAAELGAHFVRLDVTDDASVGAALREIGELDVLVNNAGIGELVVGADGITGPSALAQFDTNAVGIVRVTQAALPALRRSPHPVVVNLTSALGSFGLATDPTRHEAQVGLIVYAASKAAVSMLTVQYATALPTFRVNAVEPGFTATDLNDHTGTQSPAEGAAVIVRAATVPADGPTGTFFGPDGELPW